MFENVYKQRLIQEKKNHLPSFIHLQIIAVRQQILNKDNESNTFAVKTIESKTHKKMKAIIITLLFSLSTISIFASNSSRDNTITGQIIDEQGNPIEFATITILNQEDQTLITGGMSDLNGHFQITNIHEGEYTISISFVGYEKYVREHLFMEKNGSVLNLGEITLNINPKLLEEVVVAGQRQSVNYEIDKKIVSVAEELSSASLTAVEVLENVPSIRVDMEGNVALRGSSGFTVLIDGKPTALDPSDALKQIPASTIQNIEIMTNPSVKYDPDGTGGVINVITKKNEVLGLNGAVNATMGNFGRYGGDMLFNYRRQNINFFVGLDYNENIFPSNNFRERRTVHDGITTVIEDEGSSEYIRTTQSIRAGFSWDISDRDFLSLETQYGNFNARRLSSLDYQTSIEGQDEVINEHSHSEHLRAFNYLTLTGSYRHLFDEENHELLFQVNTRYRDYQEFSENLMSNADNQSVNFGSRNTEYAPNPLHHWDLRLDYSKPFRENDMLETGIHVRTQNSVNETTFSLYDTLNGEFVRQPEFDNSIRFHRYIYGAYGMYRGEINDFGFQLGLRTEYTDRFVESQNTNETFSIDRWDIFPTAHFSYNLPKDNQIMTSYSRRIDRPGSWTFEPFMTWVDQFNVRKGNPALEPEYIDAFELGYIKQWNSAQLSVESYYRVKHNKIETIQSVYDDGVILSTYENVGTDYSLGLELSYNQAVSKWWDFTLTGDVFDYRIEGERNGESFDQQSFNWSTRISNNFKVNDNIRIQLDGNYNSPTVRSQGRTEGYYALNAGIRSDFMDKKFSLALQARNLLSSIKYVTITEDGELFTYNHNSPEAPSVSLTLTYRFRQ